MCSVVLTPGAASNADSGASTRRCQSRWFTGPICSGEKEKSVHGVITDVRPHRFPIPITCRLERWCFMHERSGQLWTNSVKFSQCINWNVHCQVLPRLLSPYLHSIHSRRNTPCKATDTQTHRVPILWSVWLLLLCIVDTVLHWIVSLCVSSPLCILLRVSALILNFSSWTKSTENISWTAVFKFLITMYGSYFVS